MRRDKAEITKNNHDLLEVTTYLEAILNSSSDIILTLDLKLHYSSVNRAGELYLKKSRQQLIGKVPTEFLTAGPKPSEYMAKALAGETNSIESLQTETQPDLKLQVTFIPLLVDEKISGVLILAKDRTSLEKANDLVLETNQLLELKNNELEEANKSLLSFNYIASHDLKEPLRKIQTFGKLLIEEEQGKISENGKYYLERMIHSAARMQALIDALFDYSKAHLNAFHFVATPLNPIINELLEDYKEQLEAINANIECSHLPTIMGAPTLLSQVFSNLLGNAIKYRKPNLPLHIKITSRLLHKIEINQQTIYKDYWQICFRDNGIGFDQVYAEKAFDPFQRLHSKLRHFEGTGIGLTICKKLIQTHKGFIHIVSKENEGTSVYILLPLEMVTREQKQE
jgi:signal transduction histidine kinase